MPASSSQGTGNRTKHLTTLEELGIDPVGLAFDACVSQAMDKGQDEEAARALCGAVHSGLATEPTTLRIVCALSADDLGEGDEPEGWVTLVEAGQVKSQPAVGKAPNITTKRIDGWVAAFAKRGREVPIDIHHATLLAAVRNDPRFLDPALSKARAWVCALRRVGKACQALVRWTKEGAELVRSKAFRFPSVEIGKPSDLGLETITAATLTNHPAANVPALALSEAAYQALSADAGGATLEPEPNPSADANNVGNTEEPMPDEIKALAQQLGCAEDEVSSKIAALTAAAEEKDEALTALTTQVTALQDAEFTRQVTDQLLTPGKIKNDEAALAALRTVYDADRDGFTALCESISGTVVETGTKGKDLPDNTKPGETDAALTAAVTKIMERDSIAEPAATVKALAEHPELVCKVLGAEVSNG